MCMSDIFLVVAFLIPYVYPTFTSFSMTVLVFKIGPFLQYRFPL